MLRVAGGGGGAGDGAVGCGGGVGGGVPGGPDAGGIELWALGCANGTRHGRRLEWTRGPVNGSAPCGVLTSQTLLSTVEIPDKP